MKVRLIGITKYLDGSVEDLIVHASMACYGKKYFPAEYTETAYIDSKESFIRKRVRAGHESVVEHASATFDVIGMSRISSQQLVRHRLASYSQESQRFVDASNPEFVIPPSIAKDPRAATALSTLLNTARFTYITLTKLGIPKEDARFALPNAIATRIVMTMNFREYRHFIKVRMGKDAQWEIRQLTTKILRLLYTQCPSVFEDLYEEFI